jgi:hypothetical protein
MRVVCCCRVESAMPTGRGTVVGTTDALRRELIAAPLSTQSLSPSLSLRLCRVCLCVSSCVWSFAGGRPAGAQRTQQQQQQRQSSGREKGRRGKGRNERDTQRRGRVEGCVEWLIGRKPATLHRRVCHRPERQRALNSDTSQATGLNSVVYQWAHCFRSIVRAEEFRLFPLP